MRYFFLGLFFCYCSSVLFAQTTVEQVDSEEKALQFFREQILKNNPTSNYKDFKLAKGTEWIHFYNLPKEEVEKALLAYPYTSWAKSDLNGDGRQDLIINGYLSRVEGYSSHYRLFIFLSEGAKSYDFFRLNQSTPTYFNMEHKAKDIILYRWQNNLYKSVNSKLPLRIDTLVYLPKVGMLVDAVKKIKSSDIDRIVYTELYDELGFSKIEIYNETNKNNFVLLSKIGKEDESVYKSSIKENVIADMMNLASRLTFYDKRDNFSILLETENTTKRLQLYLKNGTVHTLYDDGESSFTLQAIYNVIEATLSEVYRKRENNNYYDNFFY